VTDSHASERGIAADILIAAIPSGRVTFPPPPHEATPSTSSGPLAEAFKVLYRAVHLPPEDET
jgi:hypothetical protein